MNRDNIAFHETAASCANAMGVNQFIDDLMCPFAVAIAREPLDRMPQRMLAIARIPFREEPEFG